jgi:hypothetical protein
MTLYLDAEKTDPDDGRSITQSSRIHFVDLAGKANRLPFLNI